MCIKITQLKYLKILTSPGWSQWSSALVDPGIMYRGCSSRIAGIFRSPRANICAFVYISIQIMYYFIKYALCSHDALYLSCIVHVHAVQLIQQYIDLINLSYFSFYTRFLLFSFLPLELNNWQATGCQVLPLDMRHP